jgi:hypothetical protein
MLQLMFEYDPQPPFNSGSEAKAGARAGITSITIEVIDGNR